VCAATIPSAVLAVWLTRALEIGSANSLTLGAINGMLCAAVGMMIAAAWLLARPRFVAGTRLRTLVLVAAPAVLLLFFHFPPVAVLGLAVVAGMLWK
jgi:chromate transport protein ChrA